MCCRSARRCSVSGSESWLEAFLAVFLEEDPFREERDLAAGLFLAVFFCPVEAFFLVARRVVVVLFFATLITQNKIMVCRPIPGILLKHRVRYGAKTEIDGPKGGQATTDAPIVLQISENLSASDDTGLQGRFARASPTKAPPKPLGK